MRSILLFRAGMKKILFCLTIALAIFFPKSFSAQNATPQPEHKIARQEMTFQYSQLSSENPFFDDCLADLSDDNTTHSDRKKLSSAKTSSHNASFVTHNISGNSFKKRLPADFFFPLRAPLFIFISVLRL